MFHFSFFVIFEFLIYRRLPFFFIQKREKFAQFFNFPFEITLFFQGFHVKYRIYGSSPEPASKVAASKAKKSPKKLTPKRKAPQAVKPKLKQAPQGGIEHINMNIEMQERGYY